MMSTAPQQLSKEMEKADLDAFLKEAFGRAAPRRLRRQHAYLLTPPALRAASGRPLTYLPLTLPSYLAYLS